MVASMQLFCKVYKCTSVLVETKKNAHSQSNAVSFAVTIFLSGLTGSELRLFKNLSQSVRRRLTNLRFREFFVCILRRSRVVLWVASAYIACLSVDDVNGVLWISLGLQAFSNEKF